MRKIALLLIALLPYLCQAKWQLGHVTANVNMREYATTESGILAILLEGATVVYNTNNESEGFYWVTVVNKDIDGYVAASYIEKDKDLVVNEDGVLQVVGQSEDVIPIINIHNDTKYNLSLRIGLKKYTFEPDEKRAIVSEAGTFDLMATIPNLKNCEPYISVNEKIENNYEYEWRFFIRTVYQTTSKRIYKRPKFRRK